MFRRWPALDVARNLGAALAWAALHSVGAGSVLAGEPAPSFERDVLPILNSHCLGCHGGLHRRGGLDLRSAAAVLRGGEHGAGVVPGDLSKSLVWSKVSTDEMPKNPLKVSAEHKAVLKKWIEGGAKSVRRADGLAVPQKTRSAPELAAFVDAEIDRELQASQVPASPLADDGEFLRRVSLDVLGRIPTRTEATAFLDDPAPEKREVLIDALLQRPEHARYWARLWRDRVAVPVVAGENIRSAEFQTWLTEEIGANKPWNEIVRAILTAEGEAPAAAFVQQGMDDGQPRAGRLAASAARRFLGVQLQCAECHDHPFTEWKQDDFWGLAAFFARTAKVEPNPKKGENRKGLYDTETGPPRTRFGLAPLVRKEGGAVLIPDDAGPRMGTVVPARFLGGETVALDEKMPARPVLAEWLASPQNGQFARASVNRLWWQLFGRGLVEPVDSLDPDNPPSHPALLDGLAGEFAASGCDARHLLRGLLLSRAYQRSHAAVPGNEQASAALFAKGGVKVVSAESFYESLVIAAGNALDPKGGSGKIGSGKSKGPLSSRTEFLKHFGSAGMDLEPGDYVQGIPQVLHLLNDPDLVAPVALVEQVVREKGEPDEMAARIFVGVLSRRPRDEELSTVRETLSAAKSPNEGLQAVWWALINSPEFATVP